MVLIGSSNSEYSSEHFYLVLSHRDTVLDSHSAYVWSFLSLISTQVLFYRHPLPKMLLHLSPDHSLESLTSGRCHLPSFPSLLILYSYVQFIKEAVDSSSLRVQVFMRFPILHKNCIFTFPY